MNKNETAKEMEEMSTTSVKTTEDMMQMIFSPRVRLANYATNTSRKNLHSSKPAEK